MLGSAFFIVLFFFILALIQLYSRARNLDTRYLPQEDSEKSSLLKTKFTKIDSIVIDTDN